MRRILFLLCMLASVLTAGASYDVLFYGTNFDTQFTPQYGQKILVTPNMYSNSTAAFQPRMYTCGIVGSTFPAGFIISNMLSGRYTFDIQSTPRSTPRIFVIPNGTGLYTLSTADVQATAAGTGFPSYADITNYVNARANGSATNLTPWITDINGGGFNLTNANSVKADSAVVRSIFANGNATFANHGNAGAPLVVDEFNGTNDLAQFYNTVNGRSVIISSNANITIGAGIYSGDGSGLTNLTSSGFFLYDSTFLPDYQRTGVNLWTNVLFQTSALSGGGSYTTNDGFYVAAQDGYMQWNLRVVLGDAAFEPIPTGVTILAGVNGQSFFESVNSGSPTNTITASGSLPVLKGDRIGFQTWTSASAAIASASARFDIVPSSIVPQAVFTRFATNLFLNTQMTYSVGAFSGTNTWTPSGDGLTYHFFSGEDCPMAICNAPDLFSADNIQNICNQMAALQNGTSGLYEGIGPTGVRIGNPGHVSITLNFLDVAFSHYKKTGQTTAFQQYQTQISNALASVFVTNHLVFIKTNQTASSYAFEDSIAVYGYNLMCSARRYRAMSEMGELLGVLGRDNSYYLAELPLIQTNLHTYLWDATTNLFHAGTISNSVQYSIPGTAYAIVTGSASPSDATLAATQLDLMLPWNTYGALGHGFMKFGAVRHMPEGQFWTAFRGSALAHGDYQNGGYWPNATLWVARAIRSNFRADADALMASQAWRFQNASVFSCPPEYEQPTATHTPAPLYLDSAFNPLGYYKTTDTAR